MYDTDVLKDGDIRGYCDLNRDLLKKNLEFMGSLQSWGPELQHFTPLKQPITKNLTASCDRFIRIPTIIMKIDASNVIYLNGCFYFLRVFLNLFLIFSCEHVPPFL